MKKKKLTLKNLLEIIAEGNRLKILSHRKAITHYESLIDDVEKASICKSKGEIYRLLGNAYKHNNNKEKSQHYLNLALHIFEELKINSLIVTCYIDLGRTFKQHNIDKRFSLLNKAEKIADESVDIPNVIRIKLYIEKSHFYTIIGKFSKGIIQLNLALKICDTDKDLNNTINILYYLTTLYRECSDLKRSVECFTTSSLLAFNFTQNSSNLLRADMLNRGGSIMSYIGLYLSAHKLYDSSFKAATRLGNKRLVLFVRLNRANCFVRERKYKQAEVEYNDILPIVDNFGDTDLTIRANLNYINFLSKNKKDVTSLNKSLDIVTKIKNLALYETNDLIKNVTDFFFFKASVRLNKKENLKTANYKKLINFFEKENNMGMLIDCLLEVSEYYEKKNDFKSAYKYMMEHASLNTIYTESKNSAIEWVSVFLSGSNNEQLRMEGDYFNKILKNKKITYKNILHFDDTFFENQVQNEVKTVFVNKGFKKVLSLFLDHFKECGLISYNKSIDIKLYFSTNDRYKINWLSTNEKFASFLICLIALDREEFSDKIFTKEFKKSPWVHIKTIALKQGEPLNVKSIANKTSTKWFNSGYLGVNISPSKRVTFSEIESNINDSILKTYKTIKTYL